jgi:hypothetical protein
MNKSILAAVSTFIITMSFSTFSSAAVITWTFQNAIYDDGTELVGSFDYDASSDIFSNYDITSGVNGTSSTYTTINSTIQFSGSTFLWLDKPSFDLNLSFGALTDAGGIVGLGGQEMRFSQDTRTLVSGNLTAPAVPVPAAVWLFGSGLLGLIGVASRKKV